MQKWTFEDTVIRSMLSSGTIAHIMKVKLATNLYPVLRCYNSIHLEKMQIGLGLYGCSVYDYSSTLSCFLNAVLCL